MTTATSSMSPIQAVDTSQDVIRCVGLSKTFKDFWLRNRVRAVDNLSLEVHRGELFGLLGPNGSGKSTTIKMMLGLLHPTAGRISILGKRPEDVAIKKMIGYLPEESYLYRFLNARETLDYYARLFFQNRLQRRRRVDMLLEMVGLEAVQRRPVGEYSKGMQRRIGLAQALINDPHLLILDEPTTGLDPIGTRQIKDLLLELKSRGKTILLCSHLLSDVEDVCDRVSIMYGGKVRQEGTVDQLLTKQESTTIEVAKLDDKTLKEVCDLLTSRGIDITKVDQPRMKLEALFMDIVHQAQAEGVATSGASAGGRIAEFLSNESSLAVTDSASRGQILDDLVKVLPVKQEPVKPKVAAVKPKVDNSVLSSLTESSPASRSTGDGAAKPFEEPKSSTPAPKKPVAGNHSVLDDLLGGNDK
ncbi:MAG: ABC transporter ATP-binding protein [Phycisphaeraceae bacterium]|nr:ABC transporter ATP-binding protein [Phycisphaeraceae bacterium]